MISDQTYIEVYNHLNSVIKECEQEYKSTIVMIDINTMIKQKVYLVLKMIIIMSYIYLLSNQKQQT